MAVTYGSDSTDIVVRRLPVQVTFINQQCPFDQAVYSGIIEFKACIFYDIIRSPLRVRKIYERIPIKILMQTVLRGKCCQFHGMIRGLGNLLLVTVVSTFVEKILSKQQQS
jgi:hypothetical protein